MIDRLLRYSKSVLVLPVWWLQLLIPRRSNVWVMGCWYGNRFSDNSKYLYLHIKEFHPDQRAIWLTRSKEKRKQIRALGGESYLTNSVLGVYYSLRARIVVVSSGKEDVNSLFVNGAVLIQLWHGNPMKRIGLDDPNSPYKSFFHRKVVRYLFPFASEFNYKFVVSNASIFSDKMSSAFCVPLSNVLETGCPRNDVFYETNEAEFNTNLRVQFKGSKILYYLPTFRSEKTQSLFDLESYDRVTFEKFLEKENLVLVNKGHYVDDSLNPEESGRGGRIINLFDSETDDINFLLKDADLLITDYSGAYFDFLLTERPIIFAAFDLEQYQVSSRPLYFDYEAIVAGPIVYDWAGLISQLTTIWQDLNFRELVKEKNRIFNKYHDSENSSRVYNEIVRRVQ